MNTRSRTLVAWAFSLGILLVFVRQYAECAQFGGRTIMWALRRYRGPYLVSYKAAPYPSGDVTKL